MSPAPLPPRVRVTRRSAQQWQTLVRIELLLRLRDTNAPILAACMAAACVLLTPTADAGYAVITFGGMKPVMSAGSALVAAGLVLSLLMLPVYSLGLGVGCARDRRLGAGAIMATTPVDGAGIAGGRVAANAVIVLAFSVLALVLVALAILSRWKHLPDLSSMAAYLLIVAPAGLCALPFGALLDRYLGDRDTAKAIATILFWSVLMVASLTAWPDVFGFLFLRQNMPAGTGPDFSLGIVGAEHLSRVSWRSVTITQSFVAARTEAIGAVIVLCAAVCLAMRPGMLRALSRLAASSGTAPAGAVNSAAPLPRLRSSSAGPLLSAWIVAQRWIKGNKVVVLLFAAAIGFGIPAGSVRVALALAFLIPLAIVNARRISGSSEVRLFERSTAALWRPAPLVFAALLLSAITAGAVFPALTHLPVARVVHLVIATAATCFWLTWSCAGIARPLLGISVYTLVWYLECFCDIPAGADLLAVGGTSPLPLAAAAGLTVVLFVLTLRKDSYGHSSTGRV